MPELPEVDSIARQANRLIGKNISGIQKLSLSRGYQIDDLHSVNLKICDVRRIGKRILIYIDCDPPQIILIHNAMSGYIDWDDRPWCFDYVEGSRISNRDDIRITVETSDGLQMNFHDSRKFGTFRIIDVSAERYLLKRTGPEPTITALSHPSVRALDVNHLIKISSSTRGTRSLKSVLMDQTLIGGIGNIYANEICHMMGLDPALSFSSLDHDFLHELAITAKFCLELCLPSIDYGWLSVYRKKNCGSCGFPIERSEIEKRATFRCLNCQPRG